VTGNNFITFKSLRNNSILLSHETSEKADVNRN